MFRDRNSFIEYLARHGIYDYKIKGDEISFSCPFGGCDDGKRSNEEYHFSYNIRINAFHCFKCGVKGGCKKFKEMMGDY